MSVPATWSAAAPEPTTETLTAADWTADVDEGGMTNVATGMPAAASTGRGGLRHRHSPLRHQTDGDADSGPRLNAIGRDGAVGLARRSQHRAFGLGK